MFTKPANYAGEKGPTKFTCQDSLKVENSATSAPLFCNKKGATPQSLFGNSKVADSGQADGKCAEQKVASFIGCDAEKSSTFASLHGATPYSLAKESQPAMRSLFGNRHQPRRELFKNVEKANSASEESAQTKSLGD